MTAELFYVNHILHSVHLLFTALRGVSMYMYYIIIILYGCLLFLLLKVTSNVSFLLCITTAGNTNRNFRFDLLTKELLQIV